jgi:hypothetical protein
MEGLLAAFAQFDNDCRFDRTRAGMKAALELGRWVFLAPIGYLSFAANHAVAASLAADEGAETYGSKCRFANARPEPDFR